MLVLAIDAATPVAGVALIDGGRLVREEFVNYKKTHSETLMVMVDQVLRECGLTIGQVDGFAVTAGPGSFTGLRIGLAAIKGLSMATGKPVAAVSTLEVLAHNICCSDALVCPLLDARKQEVYCGFYDTVMKFPRVLREAAACSPEQFWGEALAVADEHRRGRIILLGDGYYPYAGFFKEKLGTRLATPPPHLMLPRASALASLGWEKLRKGEYEDILTLRPSYLRLSEAESRLGKGEL